MTGCRDVHGTFHAQHIGNFLGRPTASGSYWGHQPWTIRATRCNQVFPLGYCWPTTSRSWVPGHFCWIPISLWWKALRNISPEKMIKKMCEWKKWDRKKYANLSNTHFQDGTHWFLLLHKLCHKQYCHQKISTRLICIKQLGRHDWTHNPHPHKNNLSQKNYRKKSTQNSMKKHSYACGNWDFPTCWFRQTWDIFPDIVCISGNIFSKWNPMSCTTRG